MLRSRLQTFGVLGKYSHTFQIERDGAGISESKLTNILQIIRATGEAMIVFRKSMIQHLRQSVSASIIALQTTLILLLLSSSALAGVDVLSVETDTEFSIEGASLWGPDGSGRQLSPFKEDLFDIVETGVLDSVTGVDLSATTADYQGEPILICAAGTFPSVVIDGFQLGDFFTPPSIEIGTGCYSCPEGYIQNPLLPANVEGVCFQIGRVARARLEGEAQFLCPTGQFINAGLSGCYGCPSGYDHNPLLPVDTPGVCTDNTTANWDKDIGCEGAEFPDTLLQGCYTCSAGEDHNPLLPVNTPGVCSNNTTANDAGSLSCPSGYPWRTDILSCARCSSGFSYVGLGVCNRGGLLGEYRDASTRALSCDSGEFFAETRCWRCPSGYSHNPLLSVRTSGVCFINDTADYEHAYGCEGDSFDGLNGSCYDCSGGYTHNPLLAISTPGVCFRPDTAARQGDINFVCPLGEFYDPISNRCASCATDYKHNPLFPADIPGVCFTTNDIVADFQDDVALEGCDAGEFFDLVTGSCYSCPAGSEWNPTAGVDEVGACIGLELVDRGTGDFDMGMELDYDFKYQVGVSGGMIVDEGSVDVAYSATVTVEINTTATPGRYRISTNQNQPTTELSMSSTFPSVEMFYDNYMNNYSTVAVRVFYPKLGDLGWEQEVDEIPLWDTTSGGEHNLGYYMLDTSTPELEQIAEETPIVNFSVGVGGLGLDILGFDMAGLISDGLLPPDLFSFPAVPGVGMFDPPLELTQNLFGNGVVGDVLLELGLTTFDMDTPARVDPVYQGEYNESTQPPVSSHISQQLIAGSRTGIEFGALNSGFKDPDVLRVDIDVDGLVALSTGYAVGKKVAVPSPVPLVDYWSLSVSALDLDIGTVFHFAKDLRFEPNLETILTFSQTVEIETAPGSNEFESVTSKRVRLGDEYEIIHPGGQLYIDTSYSLSENQFTNDTDLMLSPILEGEVLSAQLKVLGVPRTLLPKATLVLLSADLWPEPIKIVDLGPYGDDPEITQYQMEFADVPGSQLAIVFGPVAECQDGVLSLDAQGQVVANAEDYYTGSPGEPPYTYSLDRDTFSCADLGVQQLQLTVTDDNGTDDTCPLSLTITDDGSSCPYTIGGSVTGLAGDGLVLQNNLGDDLSIAANGSFVFTATQVGGANYSISVLSNPTGLSQTCAVTNETGTMAAANVTDVLVSCTTDSFTVSGNLVGLNQDNIIVLQNNGTDDLTLTSNGPYNFNTPIPDGSNYLVSLLSFEIGHGAAQTTAAGKGQIKPTAGLRPAQDCMVTSGAGVLAGSNVVDVQVSCTTLPFPTIPTNSKLGLLLLILAMFAIFGWQRRHFNL